MEIHGCVKSTERPKTRVLGRNLLSFALQFTGADVSFRFNSSPEWEEQ
jgi:hypothetical protein